jgi:hypothetical protein
VATDPFHDTEITCNGYPDMTASRSITQCITLTSNITAPSGLTTDTWDAHIFFFPSSPNWATGYVSSYDYGFYRALTNGSGTVSGQELTFPIFAGYNVYSVNNGEEWTNPTAGTFAFSEALQFPQTFGSGQIRLVAAGLEVVNTTAELYKQGSVTSYRSPSNISRSFVLSDATAVCTPCTFAALPPTTQSLAALFPNSRTWGAVEGVYSVATLNAIQNDFVSPNPGISGMISVPTPTQLINNATRLTYVPEVATDITPDRFVASCSHQLPFDVHGSVFTGLNPQTSLQVTVRYYIERIPTISDPTLLVLAKPSPPFDPEVLEIYARAVAQLPVAVPVSENPLGEWFDTVMSVVASALPAIGTALSPVFAPAGAIGAALGEGASRLKQMNIEARQAQSAASKLQSETSKALQQRRRKPLPNPPRRKQKNMSS